MSQRYQDWKDLLKTVNSMARLNEFMRTLNNPDKGIGVTMSGKTGKV